MPFDSTEHTHRRFNALSGEWVLVSPHRSKRPWQGQEEPAETEVRPAYDPTCYLCPSNSRVGGEQNPRYKSTYVFNNDFGALMPDVPTGGTNEAGLLRAEAEMGICRVICFSPRHDLTLPEMAVPDIRRVIDLWVEEFQHLGARPDINYVQIFENKGPMMGCSNPHPHGQIWAQRTVPGEPAKEGIQQLAYFREHHRTLLTDYLEIELEKKERVVLENEHFVVVVPFWAVWPYETLVISRRAVQDLTQLSPAERNGLADALRRLTIRYDNLFNISFPYSAGIHQRPTDGQPHPEWHLHLHFYPPLLRSASVRKFMVGYEMLGDPQRDVTPEFSAARLRTMSEVHYK